MNHCKKYFSSPGQIYIIAIKTFHIIFIFKICYHKIHLTYIITGAKGNIRIHTTNSLKIRSSKLLSPNFGIHLSIKKLKVSQK